MVKERKISIKCVFCGSTQFELPYEDYIPEEGEEVKCSECGEYNDFSQLKQNVIEEGKEQILKESKEHITKELQKMLKKFN